MNVQEAEQGRQDEEAGTSESHDDLFLETKLAGCKQTCVVLVVLPHLLEASSSSVILSLVCHCRTGKSSSYWVTVAQ